MADNEQRLQEAPDDVVMHHLVLRWRGEAQRWMDASRNGFCNQKTRTKYEGYAQVYYRCADELENYQEENA